MNTATKNTASAFADSVATVVEKVKQLREANAAQNDTFVAVNELIHDETLFTKAQRPNALKAVNKQLGTKFNMTAIKKAVRTPPEKAIHVDGLHGTADLPTAAKPVVTEPVDPAAQVAAAAAGTDFTLVGGVAEQPNLNSNTTTELSQENTVETLATRVKDARDSRAAGNNVEPIRPTNDAAEAPVAPAAAAADNATPSKLSMNQYNDVLAQIGITTEEQVINLINVFFANHFALSFSYKSVEELYKDESHKTKFGTWVGLNESNTVAFLTFAESWVTTQAPKAAPQSFTEKVATTLRGNRENGFSSGVVAAATAVIGGAAEMAFRGNLNIGSSVGTLAGATAGYFAAEAAESMMDSETGRYILAGSIGLVAGGLGSRLGRSVQDSLANNAYVEDVAQALPELKRPETIAAPAGSIAALF